MRCDGNRETLTCFLRMCGKWQEEIISECVNGTIPQTVNSATEPLWRLSELYRTLATDAQREKRWSTRPFAVLIQAVAMPLYSNDFFKLQNIDAEAAQVEWLTHEDSGKTWYTPVFHSGFLMAEAVIAVRLKTLYHLWAIAPGMVNFDWSPLIATPWNEAGNTELVRARLRECSISPSELSCAMFELLKVMSSTGECSGKVLMEKMNIARTRLRENFLQPALEAKLIEMTIPDKPASSKQAYRLTNFGRRQVELTRLNTSHVLPDANHNFTK